jgi:acyl carrier protein
VILPFAPTAKNQPARTFLEQLPGVTREQHGADVRYTLAADTAATVSYRPDQRAAETIAEDSASTAPARQADWQVFQRIAGELYDVTQINAAIRQAQSAPTGSTTTEADVSSAIPGMAPQRTQQYIAPRGETEQMIAEMWSELLGVERISSDEQFFDIGGHSLRLVQFMVRVRETFGVELPMQTLINGSFTIADAAQLIERCRIEQADEGDLVDLLAELDGLSDDEIAALLADQA